MFIPSWIYNEFSASGVDYTAQEVVTRFEKRHQNFRDFEKEFELIKQRVSLKSTDEVLDVGCGTGAFILPASRYCQHIYGVDISSGMLGILQKKLESSKISNVTLCNAGFLSFRNHIPREQKFDVVVSSLALHHLPDFWKAIALKNIADALKPGGRFYLYDVVYTFPIAEWRQGVQGLLDDMESAAGHEAEKHVSSEYSTFSWYLEELLEKVGIQVVGVYDDYSFVRAYACCKSSNHELNPPQASVGTREARLIDQNAQTKWNVPTLLLMENAAHSLLKNFLENVPRLNNYILPKKILVVAGKGNNGGDGFALARLLELQGLECHVVTFTPFDQYQGDAKINLDILRKIFDDDPKKITYYDSSCDLRNKLSQETKWCDWIVDALLGTGAKSRPDSIYNNVISSINESKKPIYSIDVPSGLDSDTGEAEFEAVRATLTTTLAVVKKGLVTENAKQYVGELHLGGIGIPVEQLLPPDSSNE